MDTKELLGSLGIEPITQQFFDELKLKHPAKDLHRLVSGDFEIVVERPSRLEYKRFRAALADGNKREIAVENLLLAVLIYPERPTFNKLLDTFPALCEEFGDPVLELVGLTGQATAQKL